MFCLKSALPSNSKFQILISFTELSGINQGNLFNFEVI